MFLLALLSLQFTKLCHSFVCFLRADDFPPVDMTPNNNIPYQFAVSTRNRYGLAILAADQTNLTGIFVSGEESRY